MNLRLPEVNWDFFNKLLDNPKIPQMNMLEVCKYIYEATFIRYAMKFYEEKFRREEYEKKIADKQGEYDKLKAQYEELRVHVPEEVIKKIEGDTK